MRVKEERIVITFDTTAQAMAAEAFCRERQIPGRLIPVPRQISAGCGLAWSAPSAAERHLCTELSEGGFTYAGWQKLVI